MGNLRVGVVGLGAMGKNHVRVLSGLRGVELVGVAEVLDFEQGSTGRDVPIYRGIRELLQSGLDYCVLAVPTSIHFEMAKILAESGVNALIEKPVTLNSKDAFELSQIFSSQNLVAGVGHIERFNPAVQEARLRMSYGFLGDLHHIETRRLSPNPKRIVDVGVVHDLATHDVDLATWLTGQHYSSIQARILRHSDSGLEDFVVAIGNLSDSTVVSHSVNWINPFKERRVAITGEKGCFVIDTLTADLSFYSNTSESIDMSELAHLRGESEGDMVRFAIAKKEPLVLEHESFRDSLLGIDSGTVTIDEAARVMQVIEAILESDYSNTVVHIN